MANVVKANTWITDVGVDEICSPFFDASGLLHVVMQNNGEIVSITAQGATRKIHCTDGQPSSGSFDTDGTMYLADYAHGAVLLVEPGGGQQVQVCGVYEDKPLKGPSSIVCSPGVVYFTDSGAIGETGLHSPTGSLFAIISRPSGQILKPISLSNLASPSAVVVFGKFIYVAEMMTNRILRFFQQPEGVFHGSVFHQLSGGVGPSSLAVDEQGSLYVGIYETKDASTSGSVVVLSSAGKHVSTIVVPQGAEVSGVGINAGVLYITEKSSGSIMRVSL